MLKKMGVNAQPNNANAFPMHDAQNPSKEALGSLEVVGLLNSPVLESSHLSPSLVQTGENCAEPPDERKLCNDADATETHKTDNAKNPIQKATETLIAPLDLANRKFCRK
jgi:hypothetical protein